MHNRPASRALLLCSALVVSACSQRQPSAEDAAVPCVGNRPFPFQVAAQLPAGPVEPVRFPLPAEADLRPLLESRGLTPRPQGSRGTCSIFTTCEAIEFAHAELTGTPVRFSPEFVNWAAGKAAGGPSDGNFFHNAVAGFEKHGICAEERMPYRKSFDAKRAPSTEATAEADRVREASGGQLVVRWIVPWKPNHFGLTDDQFREVKRVLASGYPVAAGSGHSRLLVGYRDDPVVAGGGEFITEDSALNRFDKVTYEFVRKEVADVFWVEAVKP